MNSTSPGKSKLRRQLIICLLVILTFVGLVGLTGAYFYYRVVAQKRTLEERQRILLYKSDPEKLKEAMRVVWEAHGGSTMKDTGLSPDDPAFPVIIKSMDPHWVGAFQSGVSIEFGGGWCHYGFEAVFSNNPDPVRTLRSRGEFPFRELSPGLWFYAENGIVPR